MSITSIDDFISNSFLNSEGFLKPSRFEIEFDRLPEFLGNTAEINNIMKFNIVSVGLPPFSIQEADNNPLRHRIVMRNTDNISMQFFESKDISIKDLMFNWIDEMVRHRSNIDNFQRRYFDDITASLRVYPLKPDGTRTARYDRFLDVFPVSAGQIQYDIGDENNIGKIDITFKYRFHMIEPPVNTQ